MFRQSQTCGVYDSDWTGGGSRATEVLLLCRNGDQVTIRALESSNNSQCTYIGSLNKDRASGSYTCANFPGGPWKWSATIQRAGATGGGGPSGPAAPEQVRRERNR